MANDPFPYGNVKSFGKNTTPAAKLYNKNSDGSYYLESSVEDITQNIGNSIDIREIKPGRILIAADVIIPAVSLSPASEVIPFSIVTGADGIF